LEGFDRALKDIKELHVRVTVKWDSHSRRDCAANEANVVTGFIGRSEELNQCPVRSLPELIVVTFSVASSKFGKHF